jgi:hypothetical protein
MSCFRPERGNIALDDGPDSVDKQPGCSFCQVSKHNGFDVVFEVNTSFALLYFALLLLLAS